MLVGFTKPQILAVDLSIGLLEFSYDILLTFPEQVITENKRACRGEATMPVYDLAL